MTADTTLRLFVAIPLPDSLRADIGRLLGRFRREGVAGGLVRVENLHLSLLFLGDVSAATVPLLDQQLSNAAAAVSRFEITLGELGLFGSSRSPRVVWLGTSEPDSLVRLAALVRESAQLCGVTFDDRPFKSHITLARIRHARQGATMRRAMETVRIPELGFLPVDRFHLIRSQLTNDGPVHVSLSEFRLCI